MTISFIRAALIAIGMVVCLSNSGQASKIEENNTVPKDRSMSNVELQDPVSDSNSGPLKHQNVGSVILRWHTWTNRICFGGFGVETNEATVQKKCDNHTTESYQRVKVSVTSEGDDEVLWAYDCQICHPDGVHWDREAEEIHTGGGADILDGKQERRHGHSRRASITGTVSSLLDSSPIGWEHGTGPSSNVESFLTAYIQTSRESNQKIAVLEENSK